MSYRVATSVFESLPGKLDIKRHKEASFLRRTADNDICLVINFIMLTIANRNQIINTTRHRLRCVDQQNIKYNYNLQFISTPTPKYQSNQQHCDQKHASSNCPGNNSNRTRGNVCVGVTGLVAVSWSISTR